MSSTFGGIQTALSGLMAARKGMDVVGQNITNINTPGYTRRSALQEATNATGQATMRGNADILGGGVQVNGVSRAVDPLLDADLRGASAAGAYAAGTAGTLSGLEGLTTEPTDSGLSSQLDDLWKSWGDLTNHAGDLSVRQVVLTKTQTVVNAIKNGHDGVATQWSTALSRADATISQVNTTAKNVADLNKKIGVIVASGGDANDLQDQRDSLVTTLSTLTGATATDAGNGTVNVYLNGASLVAKDTAYSLNPASNPSGATPPVSPAMGDKVTLNFSGTPPRAAQVVTGTLGASLDALNTTLPGAAATYDAIANNLATGVNAILTGTVKPVYDRDGNPATAMFTPPTSPATTVTAKTLTLAFTDPAKIGASAVALIAPATTTVDGSIADQISRFGADLSVKTTSSTPTSLTSPNTTWKSYVADLGTRSSAASLNATMTANTLATASSNQQSNAGVSLDEETSNLLMLQHAYQGAAKVMSAVDQMLDTLINHTGS